MDTEIILNFVVFFWLIQLTVVFVEISMKIHSFETV
jgi:hypothetical protein